MKYAIEFTKSFKKALKKLGAREIELCFEVVEKLANGEKLEPKHRDHALKGEYRDYRDCHITPDLVLIYQKREENLVLVCVELGSHSELDL